MEECIFCKIIKGEIPGHKVYEDEKTFAFLDINPMNIGHTLVVPKNHISKITLTEEEDLLALAKTLKKVIKGVEESLGVDNLNVFVNQGRDAGQLVPHLHYHVVPRHRGDGVEFDVPQRKLSEEEFKDLAEKIRNAI
ncbi:MAG: HIT family protein [Candidatus Hydrothermarchaeaceae archaeon]